MKLFIFCTYKQKLRSSDILRRPQTYDEISKHLLTLLSYFKWSFCQVIVAFSEYMNFTLGHCRERKSWIRLHKVSDSIVMTSLLLSEIWCKRGKSLQLTRCRIFTQFENYLSRNKFIYIHVNIVSLNGMITRCLLKYGSFKKLFLSEWTSDQLEHFLDISFIKIRFSCNQNIGETLTQCKKGSLQCFDYRRI